VNPLGGTTQASSLTTSSPTTTSSSVTSTRPGSTQYRSLLDGRYELLEVVGRGATADVHRARDTRLERDVAIKLARPGAELPGGHRRVEAEASFMAKLHHPHLVAVYDIGLVDTRPYVVMELVEGDNLSRLLASRSNQRLPIAEVRTLGQALAAALATVHAAGIVHRDVKPANVLVGASPERRYLLADFGIARLLEATRETATGTTLGTAPYLAPEQVRGEAITPAADIYALGLVLLECLTGHVEYSGPAVEAAVARLHRPPQVPDELPSRDARLLAWMLHAAPAGRPTAEQVARYWGSLTSTEPASIAGVPAPPSSVASSSPPSPLRPSRPLRRRDGRLGGRRPWTLLMSLAALLGTALIGGAAAQATTWSPPAAPAPLPAPPIAGDTGRALDALHEAVNR
jgi:serine/threonine protein kinase